MAENYASRGLGATAAALGGSALGVSLLNGGLGLLNGTNNHNQPTCSENTPVDRFALEQAEKIARLETDVKLRDANIYTSDKISDTKEYLEDKFERKLDRLENKVDCNERTQQGVNLEQAAYNAANTAAIGCVKGQVNQLYDMIGDFSTRVVEKRKVCNTCCNAVED